jgi:hypothetical protein
MEMCVRPDGRSNALPTAIGGFAYNENTGSLVRKS